MSSYISCPNCYGVGTKSGLGHMSNTCPTCQGIKYIPKLEEQEIKPKPMPSNDDYPSQNKVDGIVEAIMPARRGRPPKDANK